MSEVVDISRKRGYHHGNLEEALVEAAHRLIAEKGPAGFTMAEAARVAGVSTAAPYRHFANREAVVEAVRQRGFARFGARLAEAMHAAPSSEIAFRDMGRAYLAFAREEPGHYAAMFAPRVEKGAALPGGDGSHERATFALLSEAIGRAAGQWGGLAVAPEMMALEIWALCHGVASLVAAGIFPSGPGMPTPEYVLEHAGGALMAGAMKAMLDPRAMAAMAAGRGRREVG